MNFALIGAAGYIAPRHMKAIKETGNIMVAAVDPSDSAGIIDSYFPEADFFVETERFDRHLDKLRRQGERKVDFVSICSPNYLHDAHIRMALRNQADAICEKPLVLNPWNVDALREIQDETGRKIYVILQTRLHSSISALLQKLKAGPVGKVHDVDLTYITSRGNWYNFSWKGDPHKSGGIAANIGIHFFDLLSLLFGKTLENTVHYYGSQHAAGLLRLENARIRWFLSIDSSTLPEKILASGQRTFRSITIDREEAEFSGGFNDLHTESYKAVLAGKGFGIEDARQSIQIVYDIRNARPVGKSGEYHPFLNKILSS